MQTAIVDSASSTSSLRWFRAIGWLAALAAVVLVSWWAVVWLEGAGVMAAARERGGIWGAVGLTLFHAAVAVSPAPGEPVALANSALYGFRWGVLMNWSGWMMAAMVEFGMLRRAAKSFSFGDSLRAAPKWLRKLPADHPLFLIAGRWIPFGGHLVNAAAAAKASFWRHCWCAAVGLAPVAILFSALANGWRIAW
jgi:uncharacterized membrane protein YdjX (TVP38/TMEM64 family)